MEILLRSLEGESPALQFIGKWGYVIYEKRETVKMYIHMIISALFPIYIGSHASLRRPPSAEPPTKRKGHSKEEEYDDEFEAETKLEGLSPSDAILFPVIAGITLSTLYFIIKWFKAGILNLVLRWYFSGLGVFGVGKLAAESLNVVTTFIFPTVWASQGQAYHIDPLLSRQEVEQINKVRTLTIRKFAEEKVNPFPGILSSIQFPESINLKLWSLRALLKNHWLFRGYLHGIFSFKTKVRMNDMIGLIFGIATIVLYNLVGESWWLTNLIGFGFCYGTLQLMSPTTFSTGSLLLAGLFIYDIVMVFYTPLMVTVATSLDVPIKLVFPGPKRGSMLGLGDVVLPGIMMGLALRYDLYLHYLSKQIPNGKTPLKAPYVDATGRWGERFWTSGAKGYETTADGARFKKVYFKASLVGYVIGMLATLIALNVYQHAQPALLYLVPGVLISLWGTALVRGELSLMWAYTEDDSLDQTRKGNGGTIEGNKDMNRQTDTKSAVAPADSKGVVEESQKEKSNEPQHVFLFSLTAPRQGLKEAKLFKKA